MILSDLPPAYRHAWQELEAEEPVKPKRRLNMIILALFLILMIVLGTIVICCGED